MNGQQPKKTPKFVSLMLGLAGEVLKEVGQQIEDAEQDAPSRPRPVRPREQWPPGRPLGWCTECERPMASPELASHPRNCECGKCVQACFGHPR